MVELTAQLQKQIADIGVRDKYLTANLDRLEVENITLKDLQHKVEGINEPEVISSLQMNESAWQMTLQFGSRFIPMSPMEYVIR